MALKLLRVALLRRAQLLVPALRGPSEAAQNVPLHILPFQLVLPPLVSAVLAQGTLSLAAASTNLLELAPALLV